MCGKLRFSGQPAIHSLAAHTEKRSFSANRAAKPRVYEKYLENAQSNVTTTNVVTTTAT